MLRNLLKLLSDIRTSGEAIREFTEGLSEADYLGNRTVRRAVEREAETEALQAELAARGQ